jgi:calcineurin-like phosphoesterase family protein
MKTNIFFTSDTHFFHKNIIQYSNRPFTYIEEMNETIITKWNAKIKSTDTVYFIGDFAFADKEKTKSILERLNGNIHLCRGNHDKPLNALHHYFSSVFDLSTILIPDDDVPSGKQPIVLCHYPLLTWDRQQYGSWMLHGHCHASLPFNKTLKRVDIGVDNWNYFPVSYNELKEFFAINN